MAIALYEVTLTSSYLGETTINRWNYVGGDPVAPVAPNAPALAAVFGYTPEAVATNGFVAGSVLDAIRLFANTLFFLRGLTIINPYNPTDFFSVAFNISGVRTGSGTALPAYVTYGYVSNQVTRAIRPATKRFSGLLSSDIDIAGNLGVATNSGRNLIASRMGNTLTSAIGSGGIPVDYKPCVAKKQKYIVPNSNPPRNAYRYNPSEATQLEDLAVGISWQAYANTRHQVSRQAGRGD